MPGTSGVRGSVARNLDNSDANPSGAYDALIALSRAGIDEESEPAAAAILERLLPLSDPALNRARLYILRAEFCMAHGDFDTANGHLREATLCAGSSLPDRLWASGWRILISYLNAQYQHALTESHALQVRFSCGSAAHIGYFQLIEGLAYSAKGKQLFAAKALTKVAQSETLWSISAKQYLTHTAAESFEHATTGYCPSQILEACYLTGELFTHAGSPGLAHGYYYLCLNLPAKRAMISRLARLRLRES